MMQLNQFGGMLRVAMVLSGIYLIWNLAGTLQDSHPVLFALGVVFNAMFLPAFVLHYRMREGWFLPGVFCGITAVSALKETLKTGEGVRWMLWIDVPLCIICALVALEEGVRALKRYRRGNEARSQEPAV